MSANNSPYLVANIPPASPVLAVCQSPANAVPCTNYAVTYTSGGAACPNGAQDTPQPQPSACQPTGDGQGNIGFWAPVGTYDYTVCISTTCFGPYTITIGGGGGGGGSGTPNGAVSFTNATSAALTVANSTVNIVWGCFDNNSPANAIPDTLTTLNLSTYLVTFAFAVPQSGYCVVNSSGGGGGGGGGGTITGVTTAPGSGLTGGGTGGTLNMSLLTSCSVNQVLAWNGSAWACTAAPGTGTVTSSEYGGGSPLAVFSSATNIIPAAGATSVVALFSACSGTQYLGADGACHTSSASNGGTPTILVGPGAGTGGTATLFTHSSDKVGRIQLATGTSSPTSSTVLTVTYSAPYSFNSVCALSLTGGLSALPPDLAIQGTFAGFSLVTQGTALLNSTTYDIGYLCNGN